jgi:4-hydroxy-tetrahydrodipicolinate reductase
MKKINITISGGLGRMGSLLIKKTVQDKQLKLESVTEQKSLTKNGIKYDKNSINSLKNTNVIIDFTKPNCTLEILKLAIKLKKKLIIGTTGFNKKQQEEINRSSKKIAILQSGNMSLGINLMQYLSRILSEKILKEFQIEIHDAHHKMKIDYPSGTALMLGQAVAKGKRKSLEKLKGSVFLNRKGNGKTGKINFFIKREGTIPGTHSVIFQTAKETIELKHVAKSRDLFADGALSAAKWLAHKKPGLYSMHDVLKIR